jgi:prepilin-type N-terminal cleavage/methylation domain-containing protein
MRQQESESFAARKLLVQDETRAQGASDKSKSFCLASQLLNLLPGHSAWKDVCIGRLEGSMKNEGFSMIELLTVVAIIGILATLALSNFSMFKINAINATAASDARSVLPAADIASTESPLPDPLPITFGPGGGPILGLEKWGARSSPGTVGTVNFPAPNQYFIQTQQLNGDLCYTVVNGVMNPPTAAPCGP